MPWLHLPYDEYTMPVRCPNHRFRAASAGKPLDSMEAKSLSDISILETQEQEPIV